MRTASEIAVGICALLITYVYPFAAVWCGRPINDAVGKSWLMQMIYFAGLCLGVPAIGDCFSHELGRELVQWVPDAPILVPVFLFGWLGPLIAGSVAGFIRRARAQQPASETCRDQT